MVKWAKRHGVEVPVGLRVGVPTCGPSCKELIRRIERRAFGPEQVSGVWSKRLGHIVSPRLSVQERILKVASAEIGVTEHPAGSNSGPRVSQYQATTGAFRAPWCASFVNWVLWQVGIKIEGVNMAYCPSILAAAKALRGPLRVVSRADAGPADLALYGPNREGDPYHVGILTSRVAADGSFAAIEGNTSGAEHVDDNGGMVLRKQRNASQVQAFVRVTA